jgi:hypothetical protein
MTVGITEAEAWYIVFATNTINISKKFSMYLEAGPMPKAQDALLLGSVDIMIEPVRCSRSKADAVQVFAV